MKRDLHLKKIYVAVTLTALTLIPTSVAVGVFLNNNSKEISKNSIETSVSDQRIAIAMTK